MVRASIIQIAHPMTAAAARNPSATLGAGLRARPAGARDANAVLERRTGAGTAATGCVASIGSVDCVPEA